MILVDTSAWIEFLRTGGKPAVEKRVRELLINNQAAWCDIIRLELWNGVGGDFDQKALHGLEEIVATLETNAAVWELSLDLARRARAKGVTVPAPDLLIAACAFHHGVDIETGDNHFQMLAKFR